MCTYQAERHLSIKRQKLDMHLLVPVLAPAVDVSRRPDLTRETIFDVHHNQTRYHGVGEDQYCLPSDLVAEILDERDDVFAQMAR